MPPEDTSIKAPILMEPGDCAAALPVNKVTRKHRFFQTMPVVVPASSNGIDAARHHHVVLAPTFAMLALRARSIGPDTTGVQLLGGVPVGFLRTTDVKKFESRLLAHATIKDIHSFVQAGTVNAGGQSRPVEITTAALAELAARGKAVFNSKGARIAISLDAQEAGSAGKEVIQVEDLREIVADGLLRTREGGIERLEIGARERSRLESGMPVSVKAGKRRLVLAPLTKTGESTTVVRTYSAVSVPPPPPPNTSGSGGYVQPSTGVPPPNTGGGSHGYVPPPPTSGGAGGASTAGDTAVQVESPTLSLLLPFEQTWVLKGYERGELVSCITLTPQEEATIEVFSWDRRRTSVEDTMSSESESSTESQALDRDSQEVFNELSKSGEFSWGINGSMQFQAGIYNVQAQTQTGVKLSAAAVARSTQQKLRERTQKATERVKSSRQTKVSESAEFGSETRTTRKLKNTNVSHAVSYNYFEVLRRYEVTTACLHEEAGLVLLVVNPLAKQINFDVDCVRYEELTLRKTLLDRGLADGFEAARTLYMYQHACDVLCFACACPGDPAFGQSIERVEALAVLTALAQQVVAHDQSVSSARIDQYFVQIMPIDPNVHGAIPQGGLATMEAWLSAWMFVLAWRRLAPSDWARLVQASRAVVSASQATKEATLIALGELVRTIDQEKLDKALAPDDSLKTYLLDTVRGEARRAYANMAAHLAAANPVGIANVLSIVVGILTGSLSTILTGAIVQGVSQAVALETIVATMAGMVNERPGVNATADNGIASGVKRATEAFNAMRTDEIADAKAAEADFKAEREARQATVNSMFPPNRVLQARERFDALQAHLLRYGDYYRYHILMDRRAAGLDLRPPAIAALGSAVEPTPMALIDGKLAYRVDLDAMPEMRDLLDKLIVRKDMPPPTEVESFTLPTPGLVVEPRLSSCVASDEFIEEGRKLELELRREQVKQARLEAARLQARLDEKPPMLDKEAPVLPPLTVRIESGDAPST